MATKGRINLIPAESRPRLTFPLELIPAGLFGVFLVYALVSALSLQLAIRNRKIELAAAEAAALVLHEKVATMMAQQKDHQVQDDRFKSLQELLNKKNYWSELFKELSILMPEGAWLTSLKSVGDAADRKVVLKGEAGSQRIVSDFFSALENSQHFRGAMIKLSERKPKVVPPLFEFEFVAPFISASRPTGGPG